MTERVALLVMGMHRSGTSALTRVLSLLGAGLPSDILGPARGNALGHWEPKRLVELDGAIIRDLVEEWWDPAAIPTDWFATQAAADFATQIATVIAEEYAGQPLIVIKDPRLCRLAPLFFQALEALGIAPRAILPLRFPGEVIRSIAVRDDLSPDLVELLWLRHMLEAERHSRHLPRLWTSFDRLLTGWRGEMQRVATALSLTWPVPVEHAAAEIDASLIGDQRHFDPTSAAPVGPLTHRIWQAAERGLQGDEAGARLEFDAVRAVLDEVDRLAAPRQHALRQSRNEAAAALAAASAQIARLHVAPARRAAEIAALHDTIAELRQQRDAMQASPSWRLTAPLRRLTGQRDG